MTRVAFSISCLAALALACGDDSTQTDGGQDATTADVVQDVKSEKGASDAAEDAPADASSDDASDASDDGAVSDASSCDAGCKLFSYECNNGQFPACTCLAMSNDTPDPTCDAGVVNCFADPCQNKTPGCVAGHCVVK